MNPAKRVLAADSKPPRRKVSTDGKRIDSFSSFVSYFQNVKQNKESE